MQKGTLHRLALLGEQCCGTPMRRQSRDQRSRPPVRSPRTHRATHIPRHGTPCGRYVDWITTTPLMLYEMCHLGGADSATTMLVCGADLLMLSTGILSALLTGKAMHIWFTISCSFYVIMLAILHKEVANGTVLNQSPEIQVVPQTLHICSSLLPSFCSCPAPAGVVPPS